MAPTTGQKSIGLIMLMLIGLMPGTFGLNIDAPRPELAAVADSMGDAARLIQGHGDESRQLGIGRRRASASASGRPEPRRAA